MDTLSLSLAFLAVAVIIVAAYVLKAGYKEGFYTSAAREEPTRSYTPYTGTVPYGPWGTRPWAEAASDPVWGRL